MRRKERQALFPALEKAEKKEKSTPCWKRNPEQSFLQALDADLIQLHSSSNAFYFPSKCFNSSIWDGRAKHPITQPAKALNSFVQGPFLDTAPGFEISLTNTVLLQRRHTKLIGNRRYSYTDRWNRHKLTHIQAAPNLGQASLCLSVLMHNDKPM